MIWRLKEEDWEGRRAIRRSLVDIGQPAVSAFVELLSDKTEHIRLEAIWALGEIADCHGIKPLIDILRDKHDPLRSVAARSLGAIRDPRAVPNLIEALEDKEDGVREAAVEALGRIGDPRAVPSLIARLSDKGSLVRKAAVRALAETGDSQATEPLIGALKDEAWYVREAAAEALGKTGDPQAVQPLIEALGDEYSETITPHNPHLRAQQSLSETLFPYRFYPVQERAGASLTVIAQGTDDVGLLADLLDVEGPKSHFLIHSDVYGTAVERLSAIGNASAVPRLTFVSNNAFKYTEAQREKAKQALEAIKGRVTPEEWADATRKGRGMLWGYLLVRGAPIAAGVLLFVLGLFFVHVLKSHQYRLASWAALGAFLMVAAIAIPVSLRSSWRAAGPEVRYENAAKVDQTPQVPKAASQEEAANRKAVTARVTPQGLSLTGESATREQRKPPRLPPATRASEACGARSVELQPSVGNWEEVRTLRGHTNAVVTMAFSPDGAVLASGGGGEIRLWRIADGQCLRSIEGFAQGLAFSPNGESLASCGFGSETFSYVAKLWRVADGTKVARFRVGQSGSTHPIASLLDFALSADARFVATTNDFGSVRVRLMADGSVVRELYGHPELVEKLAFSPDGAILAGGMYKGGIQIWRLSNGKPVCGVESSACPDDRFTCLAFSFDGATVAGARKDNIVRLWRVSDCRLLRELKGHMGSVPAVAFSPDGEMLASAGSDATVRVWRASDGELLGVLRGHDAVVSCLAFSPDGSIMASADEKSIRLWARRSSPGTFGESAHRIPEVTPVPGNRPPTVAIGRVEPDPPVAGTTMTIRLKGTDPDGDPLSFRFRMHGGTYGIWLPAPGGVVRLTEGEFRGQRVEVRALDGRGGMSPILTYEWSAKHQPNVSAGWQELHVLRGHTHGVTTVAVSPDGTTLASGGHDNVVRLWRLSDGRLLNTLHGHTGSVCSLAFGPKSDILVSGSDDQTLRFWQLTDGKPLRTLQGHTASIRTVTFSPDGTTVASGGDDKTVRLWRVCDGQPLKTLQVHGGSVKSVDFARDGATLGSASADETIRLWRLPDGQLLRTLKGHKMSVDSVAFSPDGAVLASGSSDHTACLWRVTDGQALRTLHHSEFESVTSLAFSPDGATLATGAWDKTVRLWRVSDGQLVCALEGHTDYVTTVAFGPDGATVVSGSADGTVRIWGRRPDAPAVQIARVEPEQPVADESMTVELGGISPNGRSLSFQFRTSPTEDWRTASNARVGLSRLAVGPLMLEVRALDTQGRASPVVARNWTVVERSPYLAWRELRVLRGHIGPVQAVRFSPDGDTVVSGSKDSTVRLWRLSDGQPLLTLQGHTDYVNGVAFRPDGTSVASASDDNTIRVWRAAGGQPIWMSESHADRVAYVAFSPDGATIAANGWVYPKFGALDVWRVSDGKRIWTTSTGIPWGIAFTSDGQFVASKGMYYATGGIGIALLRISDGKWLRRILISTADPTDHPARPGSPEWQSFTSLGLHALMLGGAVTPDGTVHAATNDDNEIVLRRVANGQPLRIFRGHSARVNELAFNADGTMLASASDDGTVRTWGLFASQPRRENGDNSGLPPLLQ